MPTFDVFLARTYKVRIQAPDEFVAERLAEEFVSTAHDISTPEQRAEQNFEILDIETTDNSAFDTIELQ
ncbi:MAG: hypothetical protein EYC68_17240 [Chloroflexota bacterium]|nr:MAG: hypothetical protein EYC68_17240 [Chloroflexota bacterium]